MYKEVVKYGFGDLNLSRIYAFHFSGNDVSGRALKKIGMIYQGTRYKEFTHMDRMKDIGLYSLDCSEYH